MKHRKSKHMATKKNVMILHPREQGSSLVMVVFCMTIMSVLGLSLVFSIGKDVSSSSNEMLANQVYYAAESGLEDALNILRGYRCPHDSKDGCTDRTRPQNQINLEVAVTRTSSNLTNDQAEYARLSRWLPYTSLNESSVVVINSKQGENFRLSYRLKLERTGDGIQITSTGFAPLGARRTLHMRLKDSFKFVRDNQMMEIPAVITLLGTNPTGTAGNSAAHSLNGSDCSGSAAKPILGAVGAANAQHLWQNSFSGNKSNTFDTNLPVSATIGVVADISTPAPSLHVTGAVPFNNSASKAREFIEEITKVADTVINPGGWLPSGTLGSISDRKIVVVKDDLKLQEGGAGILIVTGDLTLSGNFSYDGLILVLGKGQVFRNGGGNGVIRGGILVGAYSDNSPTFDLPSSFDTNGGGNSLIQYCSDSSNKALTKIPAFSVKAVTEG